MNIIRNFKSETLSIMVLCLVAFFVNNSMLPADIMESRNIVTAREIVAEGNWMVPTMNGELRLEKPPLPTWVASVIETITPYSLGAQRAAAGLMGCVWTVFLFLTARYLSHRRDYAYLVTVVFITCYNIVLMGRTATWDIYCHAFMMGGIYYLMRGLYDDRFFEHNHKWRWFSAAGVMMGLSFLSKGPVSFYALLLPFLIAMLIYQRPYMRGKWLPLLSMIVICVIISSWWYICLYAFYPTEAHAVIQKESVSWINRNVRPWHYYWRFFSETGVWALFTLASLAIPYWSKRLSERREYIMTMVWMIATIVLLSLMPEKKMRYLLPAMAPCAMAVSYLLLYYLDSKKLDGVGRWLFYINGAIIALITFAMPVAVHFVCYKNETLDFGTALVLDILFIGIGVYVVMATKQINVKGLVSGVVIIFLVAECFMMSAIGKTFGNPDRHSIKEIRDMEILKAMPFYHASDEELRIELVYEARHKILPLDMKNDSAVIKALPCVIVTRKSAAEELSKALMNKIDTTCVGSYDDNRHAKNDRHYNSQFLNQVTILKRK